MAPGGGDDLLERRELYAFGWEGVLWTNVGGTWREVGSPTRLILNDGAAAIDKVYLGGQLGIILEGRGETWRAVDNPESDSDIWSVRTFDGATYFSTARGILKLEKGHVSTFARPNPGMRATLNLFVGPTGLWSVSARDIALFDGEGWTTIAQT